MLHRKFAKLYGLQVFERKGQQTTGFGGSQSIVEIAIGVRIELCEQMVHMGFLAQDLSKLARLIDQNSNVSIAGIIGTDLLKRLGCSVDIGNKILRWSPPTRLELNQGGMKTSLINSDT
ncbi:MAG: hypothetical protein DHS20C17_21690 [Cyclobacteriaceae bacterium]|nr:MAG: hypothetical protein DHS20C17_21690 [Cyclobacteriaceae bacterium]